MNIIFLETAKYDLRWFKQYYTRVFPEGRSNADRQYRAFLQLLKANPGIGHPDEWELGLMEYHIPRIPFTVLYRVKSEHIEILRLYDQRSDFSNRR